MKVKIYTTPTCEICRHAKKFLKESNVEFKEVDIANSEDAVKELHEKTGQSSVPTLDIDGKILVGFNVSEVARALQNGGVSYGKSNSV